MKTAVITGASSGIGFAALVELTQKGYRVIGIGHDKARTEEAKAKIKDVKASGNTVTITTADNLDVTKAYKVTIEDYGTQNVSLGAVVRSDAFDKKYAYDGDDLGVTYKAEKSTFKLWAPTATKVTLRLYADSTDPKAAQTDAVTLEKSGKKGVWTFAVDKDLKDYAYDYELTFADGTVNTSADPYATAAVANGERSVVLSDKEKGDAGKRMASFSKPTDAIITEAIPCPGTTTTHGCVACGSPGSSSLSPSSSPSRHCARWSPPRPCPSRARASSTP